MRNALLESLSKVWSSFTGKILHFCPRIMAALVVMVMGWLLAFCFRGLLRRMLRLARFDERCERSGLALLIRRAEIPWTPSETLGRIVFGAILLSSGIFSLTALDMPLLNGMISEFFLYLPKVFVAVAILALGFLLANFLSRAALLLSVNEELPAPRLTSGTVRLLVNVLAFAMALEQLGIAQNTVTVAFAITFGALMLGLALAFGLGGREIAAQFLARRFKEAPPSRPDDIHHL